MLDERCNIEPLLMALIQIELLALAATGDPKEAYRLAGELCGVLLRRFEIKRRLPPRPRVLGGV